MRYIHTHTHTHTHTQTPQTAEAHDRVQEMQELEETFRGFPGKYDHFKKVRKKESCVLWKDAF